MQGTSKPRINPATTSNAKRGRLYGAPGADGYRVEPDEKPTPDGKMEGFIWDDVGVVPYQVAGGRFCGRRGRSCRKWRSCSGTDRYMPVAARPNCEIDEHACL